MPVGDLCTQSPVCIEGSSSLSDAARLMKRHHVGGILVVDTLKAKNPLGILTDRDVALSLADGVIPSESRVDEYMSKNLITAPAEKGIASIIELMESEGVRRLVVLDKAGKACGLISSDDVIELLARELYGLGRLVQRQIQNEKIYSSHTQILIT